ncbi:MAG TPA: hypothetical protein VHJ54_09070 [Solirubrobacterales bacterium]|nr:hypothetical protein [Solirubrobacterales bacterium]
MSQAAPRATSRVPDDAGDTRGYHFRRLLGKSLTWILGGPWR